MQEANEEINPMSNDTAEPEGQDNWEKYVDWSLYVSSLNLLYRLHKRCYNKQS